MDRKNVFITGANTGIGFETVKALIKSPEATYHIFIGGRTLAKANAAVDELRDLLVPSTSTVEPVQIDVTDDESIKAAAKYVEEAFGWLDILINNAGAAFDTTFTQDAASFRSIFNQTYDVNVTGAQVTTHFFAPLLIRSPHARLIFLSSSNASLGAAHESLTPIWGRGRGQEVEAGWPKEGLTTWQGYKCAKAAVSMCMLTWYQLLKADGVKTFAVSPGLLATHLGGNTPRKWKRVGAKDASLGGELVRMVVEGERDEDIGRVITQDGVQEW